MSYLTVSQVSQLLGKSEETIKRWLRAGKRFPNAFKNSDTEGWRIPKSDIDGLSISIQEQLTTETIIERISPLEDISELVTLAYQAVTLSYPSQEIVQVLTAQGIKRTLEILIVMNQSDKKVRNHVGFIKAAIQNGWSPNTTPRKIDRNRINLEQKLGLDSDSHSGPFPFFNWLETD